ncbi:hypothetical protein, partial [Burkholderia sp. BCCCDS18]|uniref:hypothetical protein n=1 Tax=Burkholderia sp. BCCCDS18 TaxID=3390245 RepID=UPI003D2F1C64
MPFNSPLAAFRARAGQPGERVTQPAFGLVIINGRPPVHCYTLARRPICAALFGAFGLSAATAHADSTPQGATPPSTLLVAASARGGAA